MLGVRGWKKEEIKGMVFELKWIVVEKWKGKGYGVVMERERGMGSGGEVWEGEYR